MKKKKAKLTQRIVDGAILTKVKQLVAQGYGRTIIGRELNLTRYEVSKYMNVVEAQGGKPRFNPDLIGKASELMEEGYGRQVITRELDLPKTKAEDLISQVRMMNPNLPKASKSQLRPKAFQYLGPRNKGKNDFDPKQRIEEVKELLEAGASRKEISLALGLTTNSADYWIVKARQETHRVNKTDVVRGNMDNDEGYDNYDIATKFQIAPGAAEKYRRVAENTFNPVGDWITKASVTGVKFSVLQDILRVKTPEKAEEIIKENFPDCFIVRVPLDDGDFLFTPISNSGNEHEWVDLPRPAKQFQYYVAPDANYMTVKFDDKIPSKEITIFNLTDIHIGSKAFRSDVLHEIIDQIKKDPAAFVVIGGDTIEAITRVSVGSPDEQYTGINGQCMEAVKTFLPIAHKILAIEWGNHCGGRLEKAAQFDLARTMAHMLRVPYFRVRVVIDLHFRGVNRRISLAHKYGKAISATQIVAKVRQIYSDILYPVHAWFSGHNHSSFVLPGEQTVLIPGRGFQQVRYYVANGGSFVKYTGTYAEQEGFARSTQDIVFFTFNEDGQYHCGSIPLLSE